MAFDGSGTFVRAHDWTDDASASVKIRADRMDDECDGFATGLTNCVTKDGQTTPTSNLPMGGFRHSGVGAATARDQYVDVAGLQDDTYTWVDGGGTADAITATYAPALTELKDGQLCFVRATAANATTTPTFSPNGITAHTIVKNGGRALAPYDIAGAGHELILRYDLTNTRWELLNPAPWVSGAIVHAEVYSGSDIGAKINAAYAALPAEGGTIIIAAGKYDFSTPIVFDVPGKYPVLEMAGSGGADNTEGYYLNYTPTTATAAFTFDYATWDIGPPASASGLRNIKLINNGINTTGGDGSSATGILVGTTNGGDFSATYDHVMIQGFGVGYDCPNGYAVDQTFVAPLFICNTTAITRKNGISRFLGGQFAANGRVFLAPSGDKQAELYFVSATIFANTNDPVFDCKTNAPDETVRLDFVSPHFENSPSLHTHYIEGRANVSITGGLLEDDNSTGTADWMIKLDNYCAVTAYGTHVAVARPLTCVVDMTNLCRAHLSMFVGTSNVAALAAGTNAAYANVLPTTIANATALPWNIAVPLVVQDIMSVGGAAADGSQFTSRADSSVNDGFASVDINTGGSAFKFGSGTGLLGGFGFYDATNATMRGGWDANGYWLIGYTSSNGAYPLQVNGAIYATDATIATSDGRLKAETILPDELLDRAFRIPTRSYIRTDRANSGIRVGYFAQDWLAALTESGVAAGGASGTPQAGMVPLNCDGFYGLDEGGVQALKIAALERLIVRMETRLSGFEDARR